MTIIIENSGFVARTTRDDEKLQTFLESSIRAEATLFDHLMEQARQTFPSEHDREVAEEIVGNIDSQGFLKTSLEEIAVYVQQHRRRGRKNPQSHTRIPPCGHRSHEIFENRS